MEHNILVIGNGFDLAHGLNTRYDDFMAYIKRAAADASFIENQSERDFVKDCIGHNGFLRYFMSYTNKVPGWVDLEKLIKRVIKYFELFFKNYYHFIDRYDITLDSYEAEKTKGNAGRVKMCLLSFEMLYDKNNSFGNKYSKQLMEKYYTVEFGLNKREILKLLKEQLDQVIRLLQIYLKNHMDEKRDSLKEIPQIKEIDPSYVISFNYTDTYKIYGIDLEDVFHVHGSLDKNNMVLGFNDDDEKNLDFIYFKKYFQRIQKLTGYIDNDRFPYKDERGITYGNATTVHFYGHSMDNTDGDIIRKLKKLSDGFVIYKYNQEDFEQKVINLIDVFGKEEATKLIQNGFIKFEPCNE